MKASWISFPLPLQPQGLWWLSQHVASKTTQSSINLAVEIHTSIATPSSVNLALEIRKAALWTFSFEEIYKDGDLNFFF